LDVLRSRAEPHPGRVAAPALMAGGAAVLLAWPALYNGYPLFPADMAAFPRPEVSLAAAWSRTDFYQQFVDLLGARTTPWGVVLVQSAIAAHLAYLMIRVTCGRVQAGGYLALVAVLAFGSSLPWFTSLIAPDFLLSVIVPGIFLLAFVPARLGGIERIYVFVLTTAAIAAHPSHLAMAAALILVALILMPALGSMRSLALGVVLIVGPVLLAAALHVAASSSARQALVLPTPSPIPLLGRMIEDGTAISYLRQVCPQRRYVLCDYLDELPGTSAAFLWEDGAVFEKAGGSRLNEEAREIVTGALEADPVGQLGRGLAGAARQFVTFDAAAWLDNSGRRPERARNELSGAAEAGSRQAMQILPTSRITLWHTFSALFGMTASVFLFLEYCRRGDREMIALFLLILGALVINAAVTGGLAAVHGRYQSRLAWLAVLYAAMAAHHFYLCNVADARGEA